MKILNRGAIIIAYTMLLWSCKKFVDIKPNDRLTSDVVFNDSATAAGAIVGIYMGNIIGDPDILNGGVTIYTGMSSDELVPNTGRQDDINFYSNQINSKTEQIYQYFWRFGYRTIYNANSCIKGIEASTGISEAAKKRFIAEARFVRALIYFNLVNLFGDVPLIESTDYTVTSSASRTEKSKVYEGIVADLNYARNNLPDNLVGGTRFRPNKFTALSLLSRVYLYLQQWSNAENTATEILNNTALYDLVSELNDVFKPGSKEVLWQLKPPFQGLETIEGYLLIPASSNVVPNYSVSNFLLASFSPGDQRLQKWMGKNTVSSGVPTDYYFPYKYKLGYDGWTSQPAEAYTLFRVAEQYLIRAEARAQQSKLVEALQDLNKIRVRAGINTFSSSVQADVLNAIMSERRTELFCEGHRWFDIKRLGKVNDIMSVVTTQKGGTWNSNWQLYPIPINELSVNPFLVQNTGY